MYLQQFDFQIQHKPGLLHRNADSLSRKPFVNSIALLLDWKNEQNKDKEIRKMKRKILSQPKPNPQHKNVFEIINGILTRNWIHPHSRRLYNQIVVPKQLHQIVLQSIHDKHGHL